MKILVVDDEPEIRGFLTDALAESGHEVSTAANGQKALEALGSGETFDVVLTDLHMPGAVDGGMLAAHIKMYRPETPVILMTGDDLTTTDRKEMAANGIRVILSKPFQIEKLEAAIAAVVSSRAAA